MPASTDISIEEFTLTSNDGESYQVRVTTDIERHVVLDIEVLVNEEKRSDFFKNFDRKGVDYSNSCYTYLLQNQLAKFQEKRLRTQDKDNIKDQQKEIQIDEAMLFLRDVSESFAGLEALINNSRVADPFGDLEKLRNCLKIFSDDLFEKINFRMPKNENAPLALWLNALIKKLESSLEKFQDRIDELEDRTPTPDEIRELFGVQDEHYGEVSIGSFICEQLTEITSFGMEMIYSITNNRFVQLFNMHPALKALSDAKADLEKKGQSLYGARYNNSRSAVPLEMLTSLTSKQPVAPQKWLSLRPYIKRLDNLEKVENALCFFSGRENDGTPVGIHGVYKILTFLASIPEIAVTVLHLGVSLVTAFIPVASWRHNVSRWASQAHHKISPIRYCKELINTQYKYISGKNNDVINHIKGKSISFFNRFVTEYASADRIFKWVKKSVYKFGSNLRNIFIYDAGYLIELLAKDHKKLQQDVIKKMELKIAEKDLELREKIREKLEKMNAKLEQSVADSKTEASDSEGEHFMSADSHPSEEKVKLEYERWANIINWQPNEYNSILDFADEILVGLSDVVIDPMFRKSPGLATIFFALSVASLGVTLLPASASANLGLVGNILQAIPAWFSKTFTGTPLSEGLSTKVIASFLQWKAGFFISEAALEAMHGDFEFLDSIFGESEKITLALMVLVSVGVTLKFIPLLPKTVTIGGHAIPNPITSAINFFALEAKHCAGGVIPLNGIEYAFLGLKSMLLIYSLVSGSHSLPIKPLNIEALVDDLKKSDLLKKEGSEEQHQLLITVFAKHGFTERENETNSIFVTLLEDIKNLKAGNMQALAANDDAPFSPVLAAGAPEVKPTPYQKLQQTMDFVNRIENHGMRFPSKFQAKRYYDYLDGVFEDYNKSLRDKGRHDKQVNKAEFLNVFFNKHCYSGSSTLVKVISIVPLYPLTVFWRGIKYFCATKTETFKSPAVAHQVSKSFHKEGTFILQTVAILSRVFHAFGRAVGEVFQVGFHKVNLTTIFRGTYSRWTREAGTLSDLPTQINRINEHLSQGEFKKGEQRLIDYEVERNERTGLKSLTTSSARPQQLVRLATVVHGECGDKECHVSTITREMREGDLSRMANSIFSKGRPESEPEAGAGVNQDDSFTLSQAGS